MACHRCILLCLLLSNALHQLSNCSSQTNSSYITFLIALSSKQPVGNFYVYLPSSIILLFYMNRCEDCDILVVSCKSTTEKRSMSTKVEVQSSLHLLKMPQQLYQIGVHGAGTRTTSSNYGGQKSFVLLLVRSR